VGIKKEIDFLIKGCTHKAITLCLSEVDYLELCVEKKRSKMKVYKGYNIFYSDKVPQGNIYLLNFTPEQIKEQIGIE